MQNTASVLKLVAYIILAAALASCGASKESTLSANAKTFEFLLSQVRASGAVLSGGKVYFYVVGTEIPKTVWQDRSKQVEAANPYTLDANGTAQVFGDGLYDVVIKDASLVTKYYWTDISVRDISGNIYDVADFVSFYAAISAIGNTPATLQYNTDQTVSTNITIPATLELMPLNGAVINHGTYTFTYAGSTSRWPITQIFNGTGLVSLSAAPVHAEWFGWKPSATAINNTFAFAQAVAATPTGTDLQLGPGLHYVTGAGTACLNITRNINIKGNNTKIVADASTGSGTSIIRIAVATDGNGGNGDVRGQQISGINAYVSNLGNHALFVDFGVGILGQIQLNIKGNTFSGANGKAIYIKGNSQFTTIEGNDITDGIEFAPDSGDGQRVLYNNITGLKTGIKIDSLAGTYSHIIQGNSITSRDGAIDVISTSQVKILYNQIEQYSAANIHPYNSQISIQGGFGTDIIGNNLGGGTNVGYNITVVSGTDVMIRDNVFFMPLTNNINLTATAVNCSVKYNRWFGGAVAGVGSIVDSGTGNVVERLNGHSSNYYKEGTFIPTIAGSTTAGTGTYTTQLGSYTRIGNRVFFELYLVWTNLTGGVGDLEIRGLPLAIATGTIPPTFTMYYSGLVVAAGKPLIGVSGAGSTKITLLAADPAGGVLAAVAIDTTGTIIVSGNYQVD